MLALVKVKKNIEFNQQFSQILEVLKSIAVAQFHTLEHKLSIFEPFDKMLDTFFDSINTKQITHPFLTGGDQTLGVVAITSDQGLLGGLNMRVVAAAVGLMKSGRDQLVIVGEQGKTFARYNKMPFVAFSGIKDDQRQEQAAQLRDYLFTQIKAGKFGSIQVVYPRALSLVNQRLEVARLLPLSREEGEAKTAADLSQTILESTPESILEYLAFLWVGQKLSDLFGMSRLAELAARFVHLEESTHKIQELNKKLKLQYFRLRHEMIDQSMRELFSARVLYAG